jgi:hypothetical protein
MREHKLPSWEKSRLIGDDVYDAWLLSEFDAAVELLSSRGARVLWLNTPCYSKSAGAGGTFDPERIRSLNAVLKRLAAGREVEILDLFAEVCPDGQFTNAVGGVADFRPDGAHFSEAGADWLVGWLAPHILGRQPVATQRVERPFGQSQ